MKKEKEKENRSKTKGAFILTLRMPLLVLALINLAVLALRLRPWQDVVNLPGNGTTGYDPGICLLAYVGLFFWIGGIRIDSIRQALTEGIRFGIPAGILLVIEVILSRNPGVAVYNYIELALLAVAVILWGISGIRGANPSGNATVGIVSGIWSSMSSCLMACTVVLATIDLQHPAAITTDPWKQYQGLAIGNQSVQALVHSLNLATAFLLIGPLVGGTVGLIFALTAQGGD